MCIDSNVKMTINAHSAKLYGILLMPTNILIKLRPYIVNYVVIENCKTSNIS